MPELSTFVLIHVLISVIGIVTGLVAVGGLAAGALLRGWTGLFLATTVLTSATGFGFPFVPALKTLAPQGSAAFGGTQLVVLGVFVWLGWAAVKGFRSAR